jgi:polyisoprenoid-binding protein YceI
MSVRTAQSRVAIAVAALIAAAAPALAIDIKLDAVHSMAAFRISHFGASNPIGIFHGVSGTITADSAEAVPTALEITAPLDKLDMGNAKWESDIKAADWFNAAQFPEIKFKGTSFKSTGDDTFDVTGDLTLHGVTKQKTVSIKRTGVGKGMGGETRIGYECDFSVSRKEFGMTKYVGPIGDNVTLMVNIEGVVQK